MEYDDFLKSKHLIVQPSGFDVDKSDINSKLFPFQVDCTSWALKRGRAALFLMTGLGKSFCQIEFARLVSEHANGSVLILAPLAVSHQTVQEGKKLDVDINLCASGEDVKPGINITNYEKIEKFDCNQFDGIVLDESGILKGFDRYYKKYLTDAFQSTPYKLCCSATPSPNDHTELTGHAEFLNIMNRPEILATFFTHDGGETQKWRLKRHAVKDFWEWVAEWAVMMSLPSDLGYEDNGFKLPPLNRHQIVVDHTGYIVKEAKTLNDRRSARRDSIDLRVEKTAEIVSSAPGPWLIWCGLNLESAALKKAIPRSVEVKGSDDPEYKSEMLLKFADGSINAMISKPEIAGWGMNYQVCNKMIFVGLSDSFESMFQAERRCWRFGQKNPVDVYVITSEKEGAVVKNVDRKQKEFEAMMRGMIASTQRVTAKNIRRIDKLDDTYDPKIVMELPSWI